LQKRVFLITGSPGVGKTTVLLKTTDLLKAKGFTVGGIVSREVRSCGTRVGFEVMDLYTEKAGWLAHTEQKHGPKVGKYLVNLADLDGIGAEAVQIASKECDVVAIDEVGPMELFSRKFRQAVENAVDDRKPVIATIHWKAEDQLVKKTKSRQDAQTFVVTLENRDSLPPAIATGVTEYLTATKSV
jgi:nucleoside-triphosphatase